MFNPLRWLRHLTSLVASVLAWDWRFLRLPPQWRAHALRVGIGLTALALLAAGVFVYNFYPRFPKNADLMSYNRVVGLKIVDWKGDLIGTRGGFHGRILRGDDLPDILKKAFLVTEDKRFYDHGGVDWWGMARAFYINLRAGQVVQGGSTITQQLAKNLFLTQERTLSRKIKEAILAEQLEKHLTKDEILDIYLNRIYLGAGSYGVEAAAQTYFGKSAKNVSVAEAAMLAGLAKAPSRDAPTMDLLRAQARARVVLDLMLDNGVIDHMTYREANLYPAKVTNTTYTQLVNYFLDYAGAEANRIIAETDLPDRSILTHGGTIIVHTTLDPRLQAKAEKTVTKYLDEYGEKQHVGQAALVSLATDGAVRAMVGGKSYDQSQFNRATQAKRQPGSAFKPFVYLTALEMGVSPNAVYDDAPLRIGNWTPTNYGGGYAGPVTVTQALEKSINTVAVRLAREVGLDNVVKTAHAMGIDEEFPNNLTVALGSSEVTPLELTSAYAPFASSGLKMSAYVVTKIETEKGDVIYERPDPTPVRVFNTTVARDMNFMLHQVMVGGTGRQANLEDRPAAGKTGTSQDWRDAWFMGYTGDLVTGVWLGNDDNSPMKRVTGGGLPALIWKDYMTAAHEGWAIAQLPGAEIEAPPDLYAAADSARSREMRGFLSRLSDRFHDVRRDRGGEEGPFRFFKRIFK